MSVQKFVPMPTSNPDVLKVTGTRDEHGRNYQIRALHRSGMTDYVLQTSSGEPIEMRDTIGGCLQALLALPLSR